MHFILPHNLRSSISYLFRWTGRTSHPQTPTPNPSFKLLAFVYHAFMLHALWESRALKSRQQKHVLVVVRCWGGVSVGGCVPVCVRVYVCPFDPAPQRLDSIRDHDRWEADVPSLLLCEYNSNFIKTPSIPGIDFSLSLFFSFFFPFSFSLFWACRLAAVLLQYSVCKFAINML